MRKQSQTPIIHTTEALRHAHNKETVVIQKKTLHRANLFIQKKIMTYIYRNQDDYIREIQKS